MTPVGAAFVSAIGQLAGLFRAVRLGFLCGALTLATVVLVAGGFARRRRRGELLAAWFIRQPRGYSTTTGMGGRIDLLSYVGFRGR